MLLISTRCHTVKDETFRTLWMFKKKRIHKDLRIDAAATAAAAAAAGAAAVAAAAAAAAATCCLLPPEKTLAVGSEH